MKIFPTVFSKRSCSGNFKSKARDQGSFKRLIDAAARHIYQIICALGALINRYRPSSQTAPQSLLLQLDENRSKPVADHALSLSDRSQCRSDETPSSDALICEKWAKRGAAPLAPSTPPPSPCRGYGQRDGNHGFSTPPRRIVSPSSSTASTPEKPKCSQALPAEKRRKIEASVRRLFEESSSPVSPKPQSQDLPKQIVFNGWDELLEWNCDSQ